jgi:hypothetical protein
MERLDRGVVALRRGADNFVSWRLLGNEPDDVTFFVERDGVRVTAAPITGATHFVDPGAPANARYRVVAAVGGVESASPEAQVWASPFLSVPIQRPPGGTVPSRCTANSGEGYTHDANDVSAGDLDGDGDYELVLKWDPTNAKDNSQSGCTGNVFIDAYELGGRRLFRLDLGPNIRAGAHYTQFIVYDLDGDGRAEIALKTAPGTRDGSGAFLTKGPAANDDDGADHRNGNGYILAGPEYLTVFSGTDGRELTTVNFEVPRGDVCAWGNNECYGNRVDRFLAAPAYLDGHRPSLVMTRGYYGRATLTAWNFRSGALTKLWTADSDRQTAYAGQGAHSLSVADVDGDGKQELIYGASEIDDDGTRLCSTGFGHGDALHVSDFVPGRPGLEVFMVHEAANQPGASLRDAKDCAVLFQKPTPTSLGETEGPGRGLVADVDPAHPGAEYWSAGGGLSGTWGETGQTLRATAPGPVNFAIWWDGDPSRELLNGTTITNVDGAGEGLTTSGAASNNGTKSTPALAADLLGDFREEVVFRAADNSALRIYTTTATTEMRLPTLMHDPQYRVAVAWQNSGYNQPPWPSYFIGTGMMKPPKTDLCVVH